MRSIQLASLASACALGALTAQDFHEFRPTGLVPPLDLDWRAVAAGDLDGDGDRDLVFANYGTPGIGQRNIWMRNDGTGTFARMPDAALALGPSLSRAVLLADFDRDGDLDAFFGNQRLDAICRNDGRGNLTLTPGDLPAIDRITHAAAAGDIDADGDLDIVAACSGYDIVYINDGTGRFSDGSARLPAVFDTTVALDLDDYDGDGYLDLLRVNEDVGSQLLLNDRSGGLTTVALSMPTGASVSGGDVDADGRRDFVLGTYLPPNMSPPTYGTILYRNLGGQTFATTPLPRRSERQPHPARLVDLDGDGDLDLAVAGDRVLHNDGQGNFSAGAEQTWIGDTFADIDGDGDPDLVGIPTLRNDGRGQFGLPAHLPALPEVLYARVMALLDFDRDGDLDMLRNTQGQIEVLGNDGRGAFRPVLAATTASGPTNIPWQTADWTGDGLPDVLLPQSGSLLVNFAGMGFVSRSLPETLITALSMDADGDGDLDLIGQRLTATVAWFRNDGTGRFGAGAALPVPRAFVLLAAADLDGDNRADLTLLDENRRVVLLRCTGQGVFTAVPNAFPANLAAPANAVAVDLDGDGDRDLALGQDSGTDPWRVTVLRNDGTGQFTVMASLVPAAVLNTVSHIDGADLDEDGNVDLVVSSANFGGQTTRLLRNLGGFQFADATGSDQPWLGLRGPSGWALLGDLDRDGDTDLVTNDFDRVKVVRNLQRQLVIASDPAVGKNWQIDAVQRPIGAGQAGVLLSFGRLNPPLATPFGLLHVDLTSAAVFGFAPATQAAPSTVVTVAVPNQASLRGLTLFVQNIAANGASVRLGNALVATVR